MLTKRRLVEAPLQNMQESPGFNGDHHPFFGWNRWNIKSSYQTASQSWFTGTRSLLKRRERPQLSSKLYCALVVEAVCAKVFILAAIPPVKTVGHRAQGLDSVV